MNASWISEAAVVDWLIKSTAFIALAWAIGAGGRQLRASAALQHLLWLWAIASAVTLPAIAAVTPLRLPILPAFLAADTVSTASAAAHSVWWTLADGLLVTYACFAIALLLRIVIGQRRLNGMWRSALRVDSIAEETDILAATIGLRRRVSVRVAGASAPMTWGLLRPKIVLPSAAVGWPPAQRRLVLMHELAHVARADGFTQLLASLALAFFWFHPALWFAAARLRREQEHACDERVLLAGASPDVYARTLLDVAAGRFGGAATSAVMMAAPSQLEARLKAITAGRPRAIGFAGGAATSLGALVALAAAAIAAPAPRIAAAPAATPVWETRNTASEAQLLGAPETASTAPRAVSRSDAVSAHAAPIVRIDGAASRRAPRTPATRPAPVAQPTPPEIAQPPTPPTPPTRLSAPDIPTPVAVLSPVPAVPPTAALAPVSATPATPVSQRPPHHAPSTRPP